MQHSFIIFAALLSGLTWAQEDQKALKANTIQAASAKTGQDGQVEQGQVASLTSTENFINFCSGKTLTNGEQIEGGSCNSIPMGEIPAKSAMVSSMILFPETAGDAIAADKTFDIKVQVDNLNLGSFTNPKNTYYSAPQQLQNGKIVGHVHVTVQSLGQNLNPTKPPDASQFAFFKGINVAGNNGAVSATVTGGLPAGFYRVCTLTSSANHQPVIMPVAQRGAQDDCTKFQVGGQNGNNNKVGAKGVNEGEEKEGKNQANAAAQGAKEAEEAKKKEGAQAQAAKEGQNAEKKEGAEAQNAKEGQNAEKKEGAQGQNANQAGKAQGFGQGVGGFGFGQGFGQGQGANGKEANKNQENSNKEKEKSANANQKEEDDEEENQNSDGKQKAAGKDNDKRRKRFISSRIYVS